MVLGIHKNVLPDPNPSHKEGAGPSFWTLSRANTHAARRHMLLGVWVSRTFQVDTNGFIAHNDQALRSDGQVTSNRAPKHQRDRNGISVDF